MPFEPRLFRDSMFADAAGEPTDADANVPDTLDDKLLALGAQLEADADSLAELYPASTSTKRKRGIYTGPKRERGWRTLRYGAAAAVLVASLGGWLLSRPLNLAKHDAPVNDIEGRSVLAVADDSSRSKPSALADHARGSELSPSAFGDLSGAEQEAVLDLLQDQPSSQQPQISI